MARSISMTPKLPLPIVLCAACCFETPAQDKPRHQPTPSPISTQTPATAAGRKGLVVMRERKCELLGKRANRDARLVSFSHIRSKKHQHVNLHEKRVWWAEVRLRRRA